MLTTEPNTLSPAPPVPARASAPASASPRCTRSWTAGSGRPGSAAGTAGPGPQARELGHLEPDEGGGQLDGLARRCSAGCSWIPWRSVTRTLKRSSHRSYRISAWRSARASGLLAAFAVQLDPDHHHGARNPSAAARRPAGRNRSRRLTLVASQPPLAVRPTRRGGRSSARARGIPGASSAAVNASRGAPATRRQPAHQKGIRPSPLAMEMVKMPM